MRRKKRGSLPQSVSLFPFLAVLICTFGVLIILLVIVVKAADQQAQDGRDQQQQSHQELVDKFNDELELQEIRVAGILGIRPELVQKLRSEKSQRAHLQAEIDRLGRDLATISRQLIALESPNGSVSKQQLAAQLDVLQRQLADETDLLDKKRLASQTNQEKKFSIVPYDAPGGSPRRPIYIECLADKIVVQPYGIALNGRDFVRPILPNNPLDAALISVREYFLQNKLDDQDTPYPLLVVRPQGAGTYALARHAIKTWDEEFGYELIPADMKLDFGEPDPQLQKQIELAVNAARDRQDDYVVQRQLNRSRQNPNVQFAGGGMHASGQFGGFVKPNGRILQTSGEQATSIASRENQATETGDSSNGGQEKPDIEIDGLDATRSIADEKGKNWALPSSGQGAVAYRRPVRIYLQRDSILMNSDSTGSKRAQFSLENSTLAIQELVEAIWLRMDSWGIAGAGGYWKPELNVVVMPGAQSRLIEIQQLLDDSGIEVKGYSQ